MGIRHARRGIHEVLMPTIDSMQDAVPRCPGLSTNMSHDRTHRVHCGYALKWDHASSSWSCDHHGPRLDGAEAAARHDA
jgi:hypothetical protein